MPTATRRRRPRGARAGPGPGGREDEPAAPPPGQNWFLWLADQARARGLEPEPFALNFRGQSVGFTVGGPGPTS